MKREKVDTSIEQKIIVAMVTSKEYLSQTSLFFDTNLLTTPQLIQIAKWSKKYFEKYNEAPNQNIESLYHAWVQKGKAKDELVDAVHIVLEHLSEEYEKEPNINVPYLVDLTKEYFSKRKAETLKDELEYLLVNGGDQKEINSAISNFSTITSEMDCSVDPLNNENAWDVAFSETMKPLITWGNKDADAFFGNALTRDSLIAILAPEKRGKTWWCVEFAMRAVAQKRKVALFEVGDMSQNQILKRIGVRLSKRPMFKKDLGIIEVPTFLHKEEQEVFVDRKDVQCDHVVNSKSVKESIDRFYRRHGIRKGSTYLKISTHSNSSVNVQDINSILNQWEATQNFIPDIIIIDYPDILAPEPGFSSQNIRDQINATWKAMRRLSQDRRSLLIAPTQADAASYGVELLEARNFSEDKRKLAHVTGMIGLNQNANEKDKGLMRLNWIVLRESEFSNTHCLHVGQCLKLGKAFCCATL